MNRGFLIQNEPGFPQQIRPSENRARAPRPPPCTRAAQRRAPKTILWHTWPTPTNIPPPHLPPATAPVAGSFSKLPSDYFVRGFATPLKEGPGQGAALRALEAPPPTRPGLPKPHFHSATQILVGGWRLQHSGHPPTLPGTAKASKIIFHCFSEIPARPPGNQPEERQPRATLSGVFNPRQA